MMMQESVYVKLALNQNTAAAIIDALKKNKPPEGLVQILSVTEKQFSKNWDNYRRLFKWYRWQWRKVVNAMKFLFKYMSEPFDFSKSNAVTLVIENKNFSDIQYFRLVNVIVMKCLCFPKILSRLIFQNQSNMLTAFLHLNFWQKNDD